MPLIRYALQERQPVIRIATFAAAVLLATGLYSAAAWAQSAGIVGEWNLGEGSGTLVHDTSGYGNNGTLSGDVTWAPGISGSALSFDGNPGQVDIPASASLDPTSTVTVAAYIKDAGSPGDYRYVLAKGAAGCVAASYGLYTSSDGGLAFYVSGEGGTVYARSPDAGTGVWDGQWHLALGTFDGTTIRLYLDGNQVGSGTVYPDKIDYLLPDSNDLYIGNYEGCPDHEFAGEIGGVTIWDQALSAAQVKALISPASTGAMPGEPGQSHTPAGASQSGSSTPANQPASTPAKRPGSSTATSKSAPALTRLRIAPSRFAAVRTGEVFRGARGTKVRISYRGARTSRSTFTILVSEALRAGRCQARGASIPALAARCARWVTVGSFVHNDSTGANAFYFAGLPRLPLKPGRYELRGTPRAGSLQGASATVTFTVTGSAG